MAAPDTGAIKRRVILLGATGVFGQRLAARLALWPDIEVVLAARRAEPLTALREALQSSGAAADLAIAALDRNAPDEILLLEPWAVIDVAGPFQGASLETPRRLIEAGVHWIDLADARDFVVAFPTLDALARAHQVVALTGASSTPAITHAVLRRFTQGWRRTDIAWGAISPGAQGFGLSVARSVLVQVGQPVRCFVDGRWTKRPAWGAPRRRRFPGLGQRWVSLADVPDLDLLPTIAARSGLFYAGVEPAILQGLVWLIGWPVTLRLLPNWSLLARPIRRLAALFTRLGDPRGGMLVFAEGLGADGERRTARWSLVAEPGAGPSIPTAPALACLRALLDGRLTAPGARPCVGEVSLDDILAQLSHLPIVTRSEAWSPDRGGLFPKVLGDEFDALPPTVGRVHAGGPVQLGGRVRSKGRGFVQAMIRGLMGLPGPGRFDAVVTVTPRGATEIWRRTFGRHRFETRLRPLRGEPGVLEERVGPLRFRFSLLARPSGFRWVQEGWSVGPIPLPRRLAPRVRAFSFERDGGYRFSVIIDHPWTGLLVAYAGRLAVNAP